MLYLSGAIVPMQHPRVGYMRTPQMWNIPPDDRPWAADNGRWSAPEKYTDAGYLSWLQQQNASTCLFATAPDHVGCHARTVRLSLPLFGRIRQAGYRPAFVAQDGWCFANTPWHLFDVLFIGGSTEFKLGQGLTAAATALKMNKTVHMGRVNSRRRFRIAERAGCASVDGTFLKYGPQANWPRLLAWFQR